MDRLEEELKSIKTNNLKYIIILLYFLSVYSAFVYYEIHLIFHIIFIVGLALLTVGYEKIERELASVKMKNFYIKAKLTYKIDEVEHSINLEKDNFDKNILQSILEEIEL